jgi:hypothetical protein
MFTLPVWDILASYDGDSKNFSFEGEIFDGYFDDIVFKKPLSFEIYIMWLDDRVEVICKNLKTQVVYDGRSHDVSIGEFEREFKLKREPGDPDDIGEIDSHGMTVDLAPILREEIIMACYTL